ncbi:lysophospholipid acyltransferase 5-like [Dermatophagoides pteronyssinus]|uniref:lysophospholipid acyltransferase 5-like n=1 Tax=Dermatophagoides pteronyssinus TaxID=6956 RepID=UPI003F67F802
MLTNLVQFISQELGFPFEALVLLTAVILTYPICLFYSLTTQSKSSRFKSLYFLLSGLWLIFWAYGIDAFHSLINCCFCYFILKTIPKRFAVAINFIFTMIYLLYGYYQTQLDWNYSLSWTMPQCLLTLRLIAISFDLMDGQQMKSVKKDSISSSRHIDTSIKNLPNFIDYLSYCYFPGSFFVGPLLNYVSYEKLLRTKTIDINSQNNKIRSSIIRLIGSLLITVIYFFGSKYWPVEYLFSEDFYKSSFFCRWTAIAMVSKIYMYKYILCWMIAESSCLVTGLTQDGNKIFQNVNLLAYEKATSFNAIIQSYNITTNTFAFKYVYKRLKFLGNVYLSQILTLLFLSIWHGFESGYHWAFSIEFLLVYFEKNSFPFLRKYRQKYLKKSNGSDLIIWIIGRIYTFYFLGYGFLSFIFLYQKLWWPIFSSIYFIGHLLLVSYFLVTIVYKYIHSNKTQND